MLAIMPWSGVERAGRVLQPAVDLDGDDPVAGAQTAGQLRRGEQVRAGGRAGEDAVVAGGAAGLGERVGVRDRDDLVVVVRVEQRRPVADAAALDVVDAGR